MFKDLVGQKFGRLTVLSKTTRKGESSRKWLCQCDCGNMVEIRGDCLKDGNTQSGGCLRLERLREKLVIHGKSKDPLYDVWIAMRQRCSNENDSNYPNYGGRGIAVCLEWDAEFTSFATWADSSGYKKGACLDRIDNSKDYTPDNCRWTNHKQNNRNKRDNHLLTFNGKTQCVADWADEIGISHHNISNRINNYGWSIEDALTLPVERGKALKDRK